jgi:hypothetical protein
VSLLSFSDVKLAIKLQDKKMLELATKDQIKGLE